MLLKLLEIAIQNYNSDIKKLREFCSSFFRQRLSEDSAYLRGVLDCLSASGEHIKIIYCKDIDNNSLYQLIERYEIID